MPDATGNGYWVVTKAGAVYGFGDAGYFGAPDPQGSPMTSAVAAPDGRGYYVVDGAGQVFAYGDATWLGGTPPGRATRSIQRPPSSLPPMEVAIGSRPRSARCTRLVTHRNDGDESGAHLNGPIIAATGW